MFTRYTFIGRTFIGRTLLTAVAAPALLLTLTCGGPEAVEVLRPDLPEPVLPQARPVRVVERHAIPAAPRHPLERFFRALQRVEEREPGADVRVLHMGASHTASDTVTGPLRVEFARQFGDGGRGYVHPGIPWRRYRQLSVNYDMQGDWIVHNGMRRDAVPPFGLSGIRIESSEEGAWFERSTCAGCELGQTMNEWAIHYLRVPGGGSFRVIVDGEVREFMSTAIRPEDMERASGRVASDFDEDLPQHTDRELEGVDLVVPDIGGGEFLQHEPGTAPSVWAGAIVRGDLVEGAHSIRIEVAGDGPVSVLGVTTGSEASGAIYSSVGLNGSQGGHFAAFDQELFAQDAELINPDLVVFAWGINETYSDRYIPDNETPTESDWLASGTHHREVYDELVRRIRARAPGSSCIFLLPTDLNPRTHPTRPDGVGRCQASAETGIDQAGCNAALPRSYASIRQAQILAADDSGCLVWDQQEAMGGVGGIALWQAVDPPLAAADGIHLTMRGYEALAQTFFYDLMDTYEVWKLEPDPDVPLRTSRVRVLPPEDQGDRPVALFPSGVEPGVH
jgi:hypothetical protein